MRLASFTLVVFVVALSLAACTATPSSFPECVESAPCPSLDAAADGPADAADASDAAETVDATTD